MLALDPLMSAIEGGLDTHRDRVLDLIRQVNEAVLGLRLELAYQLGYAEHNLPSAGYRYDPWVLDALDWVASVAYTLEAEGLADQILGVLTRVWPYPTMPCPAGDCLGRLVALPDHWLVVCSTRHPEHRWGPGDWDGLGRTARDKPTSRLSWLPRN